MKFQSRQKVSNLNCVRMRVMLSMHGLINSWNFMPGHDVRKECTSRLLLCADEKSTKFRFLGMAFLEN